MNLFLTIFNASLFLSLGKRKKELVSDVMVRPSLKNYDKKFLDNFQNVTLSLFLIFYSMWAKEQVNTLMIYTIIFVVVIFMRYCLLIESRDEGDPTVVFYADKILMLLCFLYGVFMLLILI